MSQLRAGSPETRGIPQTARYRGSYLGGSLAVLKGLLSILMRLYGMASS